MIIKEINKLATQYQTKSKKKKIKPLGNIDASER